jgi:hypothetical protein
MSFVITILWTAICAISGVVFFLVLGLRQQGAAIKYLDTSTAEFMKEKLENDQTLIASLHGLDTSMNDFKTKMEALEMRVFDFEEALENNKT